LPITSPVRAAAFVGQVEGRWKADLERKRNGFVGYFGVCTACHRNYCNWCRLFIQGCL